LVNVYAGEPNSTSGKPLFGLKEKQAAFVRRRYIDISPRQQFSSELVAIYPDETTPAWCMTASS
jgi:hypothetical protein